ncbi:hypothetical protein TNCT_364981 [Trichonephila clavata]|uniref:Transposase n=1 Tax=Trichonephila clavata TaxID=2740835 RepID=A0A8X6LW25_TRICU|nr:hypothetical protein TNCT_364981 [Trichonephila clavata]
MNATENFASNNIVNNQVNKSGPIILHDGVRSHVSVDSQQKIQELGYKFLSQPPYSPELVPTDSHMFVSPVRLVCEGKTTSELGCFDLGGS